MLLPRDGARDKSRRRPHHPSHVQNLQQAGAQDARQSVKPTAGVLLGEAESYPPVSGGDAGLHIW